MAKRELHAKAVQMRKSGMSYSHIKNALQVSKGTLSAWLADYPITEAGSNKLQNADELRIERYRSTRASQRQERKEVAYKLARDEVGFFSERDLFVGGLSLYWGEGGKTQYSSLCMSNTDPAVLVFFKRWMIQLGADPSKFKIRLQLYVDMEPEKETRFWSHALQLPIESFGKPYVKKS